MCLWQLVHIGILVNGYPLRSIHPLNIGKPIHGYLGGTCNKLYQPGQILLRELLQHLPEPPNNLISRRESRIVNIIFQILKVNSRQPRYKELELFSLEETYAFVWNNFMETLKEFLYLNFEVITHLGQTVLLDVFY